MNGSLETRLQEIQTAIENRRKNHQEYDDAVVRQMIECIKVFHDGRLEIYFGGGYMMEESLYEADSDQPHKETSSTE